ncbi:MAG TPA: UDP-2,4-diacetamido-2,4,6-trideoxy-beta-L-altropyranose hydrolase [Dongiaceae bacterium]|nr:UDP-2,4-diacetamido-2,4,6-trideoxy-beta-L-altropyranose hydrolase [Dongiaceae bacterium]
MDASLSIGTGHVMRCLTLADELRRRGASTGFLCRSEPGNLNAFIASRGHYIQILAAEPDDAQQSAAYFGQAQPDWVVVDHYALSRAWENAARRFARRIFVIDDLADRDHDCDLLLDQNLYEGVETRYAPLVPAHCRQLIGPRFALLRPEFAQARDRIARKAGPVARLLISFGGVDVTNETARLITCLDDLLPPPAALDVVIGSASPHRDQVKALASRRPAATVHVGTDRMAELMSRADAFVGAGGSTTWERFCLGLPSLVIAVADNQRATSRYLGKIGAIDYIGAAPELAADALRAAVSGFLLDHERRARMAELGMQLVDGLGASRVSDCILGFARA